MYYTLTQYIVLKNIRNDIAEDFHQGEEDETVVKSCLVILAAWEPEKSRWIFELQSIKARAELFASHILSRIMEG